MEVLGEVFASLGDVLTNRLRRLLTSFDEMESEHECLSGMVGHSMSFERCLELSPETDDGLTAESGTAEPLGLSGLEGGVKVDGGEPIEMQKFLIGFLADDGTRGRVPL